MNIGAELEKKSATCFIIKRTFLKLPLSCPVENTLFYFTISAANIFKKFPNNYDIKTLHFIYQFFIDQKCWMSFNHFKSSISRRAFSILFFHFVYKTITQMNVYKSVNEASRSLLTENKIIIHLEKRYYTQVDFV